MIKPLNNHCFVEVIRENSSVLRNETDPQYQQGKLVSYGLMQQHITVSTGHDITPGGLEDTAKWLDKMIGKTVYWQQYADSGQVFDINNKKYALIPFYRLVGVEE